MTRASTRTTICLTLVIAAVGIPGAHAGTTPAWQHALAVRSTALNREYHLGRFAVPASAATNAKPAWLTALEARGRAMNARYRLGSYAQPRGHRFDFETYAILATLLLAALIAVASVVRLARRAGSRVPESA
jgi:hypothetical protein